MQDRELMLFALDESRPLGTHIGAELGFTLGETEERQFEDGEHKSRPLVNVRDRDVFVVQSLYGDEALSVNDKLSRLLFFLGALRDAAAGRVTAVVPYLCYSRKDRKTKSRDPVTTRYVARLFEAVDVDCVVTMDAHNLAAFQNAFRKPTEHLEAMKLFVEHFATHLDGEEPVVMSPDVGGIKRARQFQGALGRAIGKSLTTAFMEKQRSGGIVSGEAMVGDVKGRTVILIDDLISSGTTLSRAAVACRERGAKRVQAAATHGLFVNDAEETLSDPALEKIVVTSTVPPFRLSEQFVKDKLVLLDAGPLLAEAIRRIHSGGSIVELCEV